MPEMTYIQAISDGLRLEMRRDPRVFVLGEDVGVYGGAFKVSLGFQEEFGPWRVIDTPLSETAIVGGATGAALMGLRPVAEMQFADFISCAWDQLVTVAAKQFFRGADADPDRRPAPVGRRLLGWAVPLAEPGELVRPHPRAEDRLPGDAARREGAPRRGDRGSEPRPLLRAQAPVPPDQGRRARGAVHGAVRLARTCTGQGDDATVVTWGAMVHTATEAAEELAKEGFEVEVLDLRTLIPWDKERVLASVERCSKVLVLHEDTRTGGFGAEIAATIAEEAFENLDGPVMRVAAPDTPVPFSPPLEKAYIPQVDDVVSALKELAAY